MDFGPKYFEYMDSVYQDGYRRPFYETYAARNYFNEEAEYDRDCCRLQEMYPAEARKVQAQIKDACDKMEYEGSVMFDEYPDKYTLQAICRMIYRKVNDLEERMHAVGNCRIRWQILYTMLESILVYIRQIIMKNLWRLCVIRQS